MSKAFEYRFEWDPAKARINQAKHGVTFEQSSAIFLDPAALSLYDTDHSGDEDRWVTLGLDREGRLLVVSHTFTDEKAKSAVIRIISARKATKREATQYARKSKNEA